MKRAFVKYYTQQRAALINRFAADKTGVQTFLTDKVISALTTVTTN